jgi:hypothetical protein
VGSDLCIRDRGGAGLLVLFVKGGVVLSHVRLP